MMNELKSTKGPLQTSEIEKGLFLIETLNIEESTRPIALLFTTSTYPGQQGQRYACDNAENNAALFSASEDMFIALGMLLELMPNAIDQSPQENNAVVKARKAMKKALGEK